MSAVAARRHTTREKAAQTERGIGHVGGCCEAPYDTRDIVSEGEGTADQMGQPRHLQRQTMRRTS
jgi:hypothetical protein